MKKKIVVIVCLLLVVLGAAKLISNYKKISEKKNVASISNVVCVDVFDVKKMDMDKALSFVGTLNAYQQLDLASESQGRITSLNCEVGQSKGRGSVIATIDDKVKLLTVETAKINLNKASKDLNRIETLFKGNTSSQMELDNARTAYEAAVVQLQQAEKQLAYTRVTSSINGIIVKKMVEVGSYVNVGNPIASIVDVSKFRVKLNISEVEVNEFKVGMIPEITSSVYPDAVFHGKITFVSPQSDEVHNYPVEIEMPNSSKTPLKAGMFVNVKMKTSLPANSIYIPREALVGSIQDSKVYVVRNDKAMLQKIVVGQQSEGYLQVLSGIQENDLVVVNGLVNLSDGKAVKIMNKK
ncbi:MAG: efflux RND transporter periplasmic adaptor subunit [Bacteroidota bacterium]|nr:efflux RND transporter periplasmic adaptor subunit [Bacteroidota bacterium]